MAKINNYVSIKVHKTYFDKVFEPERKRLSSRLGVNFSQSKFTEYIAKSGAQLKYPKMSNKYAPKIKRNGGFGLRLL